ncbi:MAG: alpha/beta fold hydrolase [Actinomycetota bacterium]|nr:alpha/beta fold hydrolase [Actinomycetota bacterium]
MTRTPDDDTHPVKPGCEPWTSPAGGPNGALVLHGFTGTPISMRGVAGALADAGFAVSLPRLPGHGTAVEDMLETGWDDWLAEAERALAALQQRCADGRIVVVGLSMGGSLTLALATTHPELAGIVCINTPVSAPEGMEAFLTELADGGTEVMDGIGGDIADPEGDEMAYPGTPVRPLLSMLAAADTVGARLGDIAQPVLVITSRQDHVVDPTNSDLLASSVSGPVERLWLEKSYHVATVDYDKAEVQSATVDFATRVTS